MKTLKFKQNLHDFIKKLMTNYGYDEIDLSSNNISSDTLTRILMILKSYNTGVTRINLANNSLGGKKTSQEEKKEKADNKAPNALALKDAVEYINATGLKEINLSNNRLDAGDSKYLFAIFSQVICKITKLNLSKNNIGIDCLPALLPLLAGSNKLEELIISDNPIKANAKEFNNICQTLATNPNLKVFKLGNHDFSCFLQSSNISELTPSQINHFTPALVLVALKFNTTIRKVVLTLTNQEFPFLLQAIKENKSLQIIDLEKSNLSLGKEEEEALFEAVKTHPCLTELKLPKDCQISKAIADHLNQALDFEKEFKLLQTEFYNKSNDVNGAPITMGVKFLQLDSNDILRLGKLECERAGFGQDNFYKEREEQQLAKRKRVFSKEWLSETSLMELLTEGDMGEFYISARRGDIESPITKKTYSNSDSQVQVHQDAEALGMPSVLLLYLLVVLPKLTISNNAFKMEILTERNTPKLLIEYKLNGIIRFCTKKNSPNTLFIQHAKYFGRVRAIDQQNDDPVVLVSQKDLSYCGVVVEDWEIEADVSRKSVILRNYSLNAFLPTTVSLLAQATNNSPLSSAMKKYVAAFIDNANQMEYFQIFSVEELLGNLHKISGYEKSEQKRFLNLKESESSEHPAYCRSYNRNVAIQMMLDCLVLKLINNKASVDQFKKFFDQIPERYQFQFFDTIFSQISLTSELGKAIAKELVSFVPTKIEPLFEKFPSLLFFDDIDDVDAKLIESLKKLSQNPKELIIKDVVITNTELKIISYFLQKVNRLVINQSVIKSEAAQPLGEDIGSNNLLTSLEMSNNLFESNCVDEFVKELINNYSLRKLIFSNNKMTPETLLAMENITQSIKEFKQSALTVEILGIFSQWHHAVLTELDLSLSNLYQFHMDELITWLKKIPCHNLNLSRNKVGNNAFRVLRNSVVRVLNLSENQLDVDSLKDFPEILRLRSEVGSSIFIDLSHNTFVEAGIVKLSTVLTNSKLIVGLNLSNNSLSFAALKALEKLLKQNRTIIFLKCDKQSPLINQYLTRNLFCKAITDGNESELKELLDKFSDKDKNPKPFNFKDIFSDVTADGETLLHLAVRVNNETIVQILLKHLSEEQEQVKNSQGLTAFELSIDMNRIGLFVPEKNEDGGEKPQHNQYKAETKVGWFRAKPNTNKKEESNLSKEEENDSSVEQDLSR